MGTSVRERHRPGTGLRYSNPGPDYQCCCAPRSPAAATIWKYNSSERAASIKRQDERPSQSSQPRPLIPIFLCRIGGPDLDDSNACQHSPHVLDGAEKTGRSGAQPSIQLLWLKCYTGQIFRISRLAAPQLSECFFIKTQHDTGSGDNAPIVAKSNPWYDSIHGMAGNRLPDHDGRSVLRSPILKCGLTWGVPPWGVGNSTSAHGKSGEAVSARSERRKGSGGGHVQEQSIGEGSERADKCGRSHAEDRATARLRRTAPAQARADRGCSDTLMHWLWNVDRRQHRMQWSSAGVRPHQRRVAGLRSPNRRWCEYRGQRDCAGRHNLRERQGHHPCRPCEAAKRRFSRGRHLSSLIVDRRELSIRGVVKASWKSNGRAIGRRQRPAGTGYAKLGPRPLFAASWALGIPWLVRVCSWAEALGRAFQTLPSLRRANSGCRIALLQHCGVREMRSRRPVRSGPVEPVLNVGGWAHRLCAIFDVLTTSWTVTFGKTGQRKWAEL